MMHPEQRTRLTIGKPVKIFGALILLAAISVFGLYSLDASNYTGSQIEWFLALNHSLSGFPDFWLNITIMGDAVALFPALSFVLMRSTRTWAALFASVPLASILSNLGKQFFAIPRPAAIIEPDRFALIGEVLRAGTSLPSGHTITIFAAMTAVAGIMLYENKTRHAYLWCAFLMILAGMVALSRVAVGAHWPADLLLGAFFGILSGLSGVLLSTRFTGWWRWMSKPDYRYIHIAVLAILMIATLVEYRDLIIAWLSVLVAGFVIVRFLRTSRPRQSHP